MLKKKEEENGALTVELLADIASHTEIPPSTFQQRCQMVNLDYFTPMSLKSSYRSGRIVALTHAIFFLLGFCTWAQMNPPPPIIQLQLYGDTTGFLCE